MSFIAHICVHLAEPMCPSHSSSDPPLHQPRTFLLHHRITEQLAVSITFRTLYPLSPQDEATLDPLLQSIVLALVEGTQARSTALRRLFLSVLYRITLASFLYKSRKRRTKLLFLLLRLDFGFLLPLSLQLFDPHPLLVNDIPLSLLPHEFS